MRLTYFAKQRLNLNYSVSRVFKGALTKCPQGFLASVRQKVLAVVAYILDGAVIAHVDV